ncbi:MAG: hypothetical protein COV67_14155 [Nitrospinae bacterium CG11_big_fil_rev_8_21_14_0_20_56_8]|nr:MAG: hypothetical protein COV67_14155 [Nitrospinae bacterium CG11_big_fil_rev_8_21_14_0_20_56_8]
MDQENRFPERFLNPNPTIFDLKKLIVELEKEITERKAIEQELLIANENLRTEIEERKKAEQGLIAALEANSKLDRLANTDDLTGLANRRFATDRIEYETSRFERNKKPFSVVMCDLDDFKKLNDHLGYTVGDFVLNEAGKLLRQNIRKQDLVSRWGGELFLLFLPETELSGAVALLEKLRQKIEASTFRCNGHDLRTTMSFGVSEFEEGFSVEKYLKKVDQCLYLAKKSGKNQVVSHTGEFWADGEEESQ